MFTVKDLIGLLDLNDPVVLNGLLMGKIAIFLGDFKFDKYGDPLYVSTRMYTKSRVITTCQLKYKGKTDESFLDWDRRKWLESFMEELKKHNIETIEKTKCEINFGDPKNKENTYKIILSYDRTNYSCTISRNLVGKTIEEAELTPRELEMLKSTSRAIKLSKRLKFSPIETAV